MANPILDVLANDPGTFGSYASGVQARQGQQYNKLRQTALQQDVDTQKRLNTLADDERKSQEDLAGAERVLSSPNPKATVEQLFPHLIRDQRQWATLTDDDIRGFASQVRDQAMMKLGAVAPKASPLSDIGRLRADVKSGFATEQDVTNALAPKTQGFSLNPGERRYDANGNLLASAPAAPQKPAEQWNDLTPQQIQAAGLPAGTAAQRNSATGEVRVLSKRDTSATLSQKDATTAKQKLTTIRVAKKQIADIKQAFADGTKGINAFGPTQGHIPTQQGKKFDAAVDRMRSTLTALTRVPGVGAMSDYETKLDQGKFPNRTAYESVTAEQIQGIEDLLATIEQGYTDLLSGNQTAAPEQQQQPQPGAVPTFATEAEAEAAGLAPGTRVIIGGVSGMWQ